VDGSFATGGAVFVVLMIGGANVWVAMLASVLAGMLAGLVTGFFHTICGIPAILAGILTQLGLWSVNLAVMGWSSNKAMNLNKVDLLVSMRHMQEVEAGMRPFYRHPIVMVGVGTAVIIGLLYWFFGTARGASIRATGANTNMARAQGINTNVNKVIGLMIGNGLVALSGCLWTQYFGFAEINMGRGAIVIGLAAIIIGEVIFSKIFINFGLKLLAVSIGAVIYYMVVQFVVSVLAINTNYLKLFSALIVAVFLVVPYWKQEYFHQKRKEGHHAEN
jgi:putative ABC transport system permease protein